MLSSKLLVLTKAIILEWGKANSPEATSQQLNSQTQQIRVHTHHVPFVLPAHIIVTGFLINFLGLCDKLRQFS